MVVRSRLSDMLAHDHSLYDPLLRPKRSACNRKLANDKGRFIRIQIP
jgi:hypothetical protein